MKINFDEQIKMSNKKKVDQTQGNHRLHEKSQQEVEAKRRPQVSAARMDSEMSACYDLSVFPKGASNRGSAPSMVVLGRKTPKVWNLRVRISPSKRTDEGLQS